MTLRVDSDREPIESDRQVLDALDAAASEAGIPVMAMTSGAVHDAMQLAAIAKVAMVFVRSQGGISHSPDEFTSSEDAAAGAEVLARALHHMAYRT